MTEIETRDIGASVRKARERRGLSQSELAGRVGLLDQSKISRIENGNRKVSSVELAEIADALGESPTALLYGTSATLHPSPSGDALGDALAARARSVTAIAGILAETGHLAAGAGLSTSIGLPSDVNEDPSEWGRVCAKAARSQLGLDESNAGLEARVEESLGLDLLLEPFPSSRRSLVSETRDALLIVINSNSSLGTQRFALANEVAGLYWRATEMWLPHYETPRARERFTASFARYFLMPVEPVRGRRSDDPIAVAAELQVEWGVNFDLLVEHLGSTGVLGPDAVKSVEVTGGREAANLCGLLDLWRSLDSARDRRLLPSRISDAAFAAYQEGEIGLRLLAEFRGEEEASTQGWLAEDLSLRELRLTEPLPEVRKLGKRAHHDRTPSAHELVNTVQRLRAVREGRTLHLVDLENLMGQNGRRTDPNLTLAKYLEVAEWQPGDQTLIAASPAVAARFAFDMPIPASVHAVSSHAAIEDLLLSYAQPSAIARRFQRVVFGSGDRIFEAPARSLIARGVEVRVVARAASGVLDSVDAHPQSVRLSAGTSAR